MNKSYSIFVGSLLAILPLFSVLDATDLEETQETAISLGGRGGGGGGGGVCVSGGVGRSTVGVGVDFYKLDMRS
jgi:hypothetical protein